MTVSPYSADWRNEVSRELDGKQDTAAALTAFLTAGGYSSGTWTPNLQFGSAQVGITYSTRTGNWVRVGRVVVAEFDFTLSSKGTSVGSATISNFPVTNDSPIASGFIGFHSNLAMAAASPITFTIGTNNIVATLRTMSATSPDNLTNAHLLNNSRLAGVVTYIAA